MLARSHGGTWHRRFSDVDEQDAQYVGQSKLVAKPLNCWVVKLSLPAAFSACVCIFPVSNLNYSHFSGCLQGLLVPRSSQSGHLPVSLSSR